MVGEELLLGTSKDINISYVLGITGDKLNER